MSKQKIIAFDVGGTSIKSGVVEGKEDLIGPIIQTPIHSKGTKDEILAVFQSILNHHLEQIVPEIPTCLALAIPGPFDYENGISKIQGVQKYEAIYDFNLRTAFQTWLPHPDIPIFFCNDAEAAITGEAQCGVGATYKCALGVTLGTGLGGAFMLDGIPQRTGKGVTSDGEIYYFKFNGEIGDDVFSIRGLSKRLKAAGLHYDSIQVASEAARTNDLITLSVFKQFGTDFGIFLNQILADFEADAVLALGGISNARDLFGAEVEAVIQRPFVQGILGQKAPLLGAVALAKINHRL